MYDFETIVPEFGELSPMRRRLRQGGFPEDSICYGVAEMKFPLLPDISAAVCHMANKGWLGYSAGYDEYYDAVCAWMSRRHSWSTSPEEIVTTYGVVQAIGICVRAFTAPGDAVLIQMPVYNPFMSQIEGNGRKTVENRLVFDKKRYNIDFNDFEEKVKQNNIKMFILCSPHNPVGRVWSKNELKTMADICEKYGVLVISDEIHNDIVYGGEHTVFSNISPYCAENCVVCTAPSKTFNIPGLVTSNIVIKNKELRERFRAVQRREGEFINPVGVAACRAAYEKGDAWVDEMTRRIGKNMEILESEIERLVPGAVMTKAEGTYLAWVDMGFLGVSDETMMNAIKTRGGLCVNPGYIYGEGGRGHIRINIGCPEKYVYEAVRRLAKGIEGAK